MSLIHYDGDKKYVWRIRQLRIQNDYTQKYVACRLNTSQTMYARYERDASELPIRHLMCLAQMYEVSTDYILGLTDNPQPVDILMKRYEKDDSNRFNFKWKTSR